jgi:ubiquinone/menaquinone biosynthesis C-methylase UbiE
MAQEQAVDLKQVTQVQQQIWSQGDFSRIGVAGQVVAENLAEAANVRAGERVLDVACGAGNGAIAAARRTWDATVGLDYVPALLERGRERAAAERLEVEFVQGDAQELPFEDESFDVVMSIFGAMFAPDHRRTADELLRVTKSGGRVAMANWTPAGFVGTMFRTVAGHAPPPPGVAPPPLWGTEEHLQEVFGDRISGLSLTPRHLHMRYRSPDHFIDLFRTWFGPMKVAFERVGPDGEDALAGDLRDLLERSNTDDDTLVVPSEYLEVVATKA